VYLAMFKTEQHSSPALTRGDMCGDKALTQAFCALCQFCEAFDHLALPDPVD